MKVFIRITLFYLLSILMQQSAIAQQYPITASTQIIPPYSVYLPDYAVPGSDKLRVILVQNDLTQPSYEVRLRMTVEMNGAVIMRTSQAFTPKPLALSPGIPTIISGADLYDYLNSNNIDFSGGFSRETYDRTKALPEGAYRISFTAYDYRRSEVQISNIGSNIFFFQKSEPPVLNQPVCDSRVVKMEPQFLTFNWSSRNTPNPLEGSGTEYVFSLYEIKPKGSNPDYIIRSAKPLYTTITESNTLIYGPGEPQLIDSMDYVWVVQARDKSGRDMYSNQGLSKSCKFSYLSNNPFAANNIGKPKLNGEATGERTAKLWWPLAASGSMYSVEAYRVQYRAAAKDGQEFDWFTEEKENDTTLALYNLEPSRAYEARLQWRVAGVYGPYSDLVTFTTQALRTFTCGESPQVQGTQNTNPLPVAVVGMPVKIGHFDVLLTDVSGSNGVFSGKGRIITPGFGMGLLMEFKGITINTDLVVIRGEMQAVTSGIDKFVDNAVKEQRGGADVGKVKTGDIIPDVTTNLHIFSKDNIVVNTDAGTITLKDSNTGKEEVINYKDQSKTLPLVLEDADGNLYNIDKNGKVTAAGTRDKSLAGNTSALAALNTLQLDSGVVNFTAATTNRYAFDSWKSSYEGKAVLDSSYEKLANGKYRVSAKALVPGEQEDVLATLSNAGSINTDKIKFVSGKGIVYPSKKTGNTWTITLTGGPAGDAQEVFAVYPKSDGQYISMGKLLVASYTPLQNKIVLIPVGTQVQIPEEAIKNSLIKAYAKVGVTYTVITDTSFQRNTSWDDNKDGLLQDTKSAFLSNGFTGEEKALKNAYKKLHDIDDNTTYLFLVNEAAMKDGDLLGKMPRQSQFGFIFLKGATTEDISRTVSHETGHGAYTLEHTFSDGIGLKQRSTDNLMDYDGGYELLKYQWDVVHSPGHVWGIFEGDDDSEQQKVKLVALLKWINDNKGKEVAFNKKDYLKDDDDEIFHNIIKLDDKDVDIFADVFGTGKIDLTTNNQSYSYIRAGIKIPGLGQDLEYGASTKNIPFKNKYHTVFYLAFYYKPEQNKPAIQLYTHSYAEYALLLKNLSLSIDQLKPSISALYKKAFTLAGTDCDKVDVIYEGIPDFVLKETDDNIKWSALKSLSGCVMDEKQTNEETGVLNILNGFKDEHLLYDSLKANPDVVLDLWHGMDNVNGADNSDAYAAFLLNLANRQWTPAEKSAVTRYVYWGEGFDEFKQGPVNVDLLLQIYYNGNKKNLSVTNTFGRVNLIPDTYQQGTPVGDPFTVNVLEPVKMIFDLHDESVKVPGIYLYHVGISKNRKLAKGKMLDLLTYLGAASSVSVLVTKGTPLLLRAVALAQLIKIPVDDAMKDKDVREKLNDTEGGRQFLSAWPYLSIGLDVTMLSTDIIYRFVKSSGTASSVLRDGGYGAAGDDVDDMAKKLAQQAEAQAAQDAALATKLAQEIDDLIKIIKQNLLNRIAKEEGFILNYTDDELRAIITNGKKLSLPNNEIEDIIFNGCRPGKAKEFTADVIISQTNVWSVIKQRGYPSLFKDMKEFEDFGDIMKQLAKEWNLPEGSIFVQGSSLRIEDISKIGDLDVAIKVDAATFAQLEAKFKSMVTSDKVLARIGNNGKIGGLDMFQTAVKGEKSLTVQFYERFEALYGMKFPQKMGVEKIQISIIQEGGSLDVTPYLQVK